jgi:hypothetical protein
MNRAIGLPLAAVVVLGLNACASSGIEDTQFRRRSTSLTTLKSDSAQCWKLAQKKNVSAADATGGVVMGTILFGVIGAAATAYAVEQDKQDPKNSVRRAAHDECMTQRGYKKVE